MTAVLQSVIEWVAVALNLVFVLLIIKQKKAGWLFGIIGSALSVLLFVSVKLYSEAVLYMFYVVMGVYGWQQWNKQDANHLEIGEWITLKHLRFIMASVALSIGLGAFFNSQTDATRPYFDAFSTVFSFLATYLEAKKILSAWIYWIVLNAFSIWLYSDRGLPVYAGLMALYTVLSVVGYLEWRKSYKTR